jgi:hypothetical protein
VSIAALLLLALAQQAPSAQPTRDVGKPAPWADPIDVAENVDSRPAARVAVQGYGRCVAGASPDKAAEVLAMDFTTPRYRRALATLSKVNEGCFGRRGRMRASPLLFAGAVAEALIVGGPVPLNIRLARAVGTAAATFSPSDRVATCAVHSAPDQVAALFASAAASEGETQALRDLDGVLGRCAERGPALKLSAEATRAMLATATFRVLNAGEGR